ncbi:sensor histidine kinase [Solimonas soli]|uniref:sensor histidine kinase n=1 Tax=Solimonas soli TaxID=413479 RepID=UPI0004B28ECD|nr:HAMP domain-containing sensor histidine kinase [Solimonas soli]
MSPFDSDLRATARPETRAADAAAAPRASWRSSSTRLLLIYGALFVLWSTVLIGVVHWETRSYLSTVVDEILEQRAHYLSSIERARLPDAMAAASQVDLQGVMAYGLFAPDGRYRSGNITQLPGGLPVDGRVRLLRDGIERSDRRDSRHAAVRALALRLDGGEVMVLARSTRVLDQVGVILRQSLLWALSLTLIPGLIGGYLLSRGPLRRVRAIEAAVQPIMRGNLDRRLPVSRRRDELDLLASIVNTMLAELERLMVEVKGVCDNIAHDLRTPLTRLRAQLHRLQQQTGGDDERGALIEHCIGDVNALLQRFSALLRISEMEDLRRRAGFAEIDLGALLRDIHDLYAPLAEDKSVQIRLALESAPRIAADRELLFEAISNLVSNAIKFTPGGGTVRLRLKAHESGAKICVVDTGPGIPAGERDAVLQRFYRSDGTRQAPGFGLGLSIVSAIVRLHGFRLEISEGEGGGTRVSLFCVPQDLAIGAGTR